jgi:hypothetical protein
MARKQNPINDIINTVGGWLGGRGPGTNPQVRAAMDATRAVGKVVDTATGGFGQALISDAQRMAQSGSSTPSALYKTAAVNLGAAATGVGAAKVAGKVVGKVADASRVPRFDWDPKPYRDIPSESRANIYWKPETDVVNPQRPDINYSVVVRPNNPKATVHANRALDKGYKVEMTRIDASAMNKTFDSAEEYRQITGVRKGDVRNATNIPTTNQFMNDITNQKVYKDLKKAQRAAERMVKRDIKKR